MDDSSIQKKLVTATFDDLTFQDCDGPGCTVSFGGGVAESLCHPIYLTEGERRLMEDGGRLRVSYRIERPRTS